MNKSEHFAFFVSMYRVLDGVELKKTLKGPPHSG
jgi:hypothetical protein